MARLIWSPDAQDDLRGIRRYIAKSSRQRAALFVLNLLEAAERLERFPQSGRIVPEDRSRERREIIVYGYRVMYRVRGDDVVILSVVHGARRITELPDL